jgi:hypothetical protein
MALITEDGTGRSDAESYCSVAAADSYHSKRGNSGWTALDVPTKEQALRKATDYMAAFRGRWEGYRKLSTQALDWPRYLVPVKDALDGFGQAYYADDAVPAAVQNACAELALKTATGTVLAPDLDPPIVREKVGPLETEYLPGTRQTVKFYAVELMLQPFFSGSSTSMKVSRA